MRFAIALAAIPLLIGLLTFLALRTFNGEAERFDQALAEIDQARMHEAALQRDVLSMRAGVLRNYDPLVAEANELRSTIARLSETVAPEPEMRPLAQTLHRTVERQEDLLEQIKTSNALLQNSLAYFSRFSSETESADDDSALSATVGALTAAMLRLTLDTSAESAQSVQERLDNLNQHLGSHGSPVAHALLAHGQLLRAVLPATDHAITEFLDTSTRTDWARLRSLVQSRQVAIRASAHDYRLALYGVSLLLVMLLAYLGWALRNWVHLSRQRAAFERVVADSAMRFVAAGEKDLPGTVSEALSGMARCIGAERAYFIALGPESTVYRWNDAACPYPADWPDHVPPLYDRCCPGATDRTVSVPSVRRLPGCEDRAALEAASVRGWVCVEHTPENGSRMFLGFDAVSRSARIANGCESGMLRLGLDAIANALSRRAFEQERERLEVRLQHAQRLETVGALAGGIAHNFNNILAAILGYTELAAEQDPLPGRNAGILQEIRLAVERARAIVDQILSFARKRPPQFRPVQIGKLVQDSVSLLNAALPETVQITVAGSQEGMVSGEPAQLQQVILNLCHNAADAMGNVGVISLYVAPVELVTERRLSHGTLPAGRYLCLSVADSGKGIDPAAREWIFEPFFTTRGDGNGLGLATALETVSEHGGAMHMQSTVGVGTTFEVWLPRLAEAADAASAASTTPHGNGETILLLESDLDNLLRSEDLLAALGFEPVGFQHAADAENVVRTGPDRFDAFFIGELGSTAEALRFAAFLHEQAPARPIVMAAISPRSLNASELTEAGIADIVRFPLAATEIAASLGRVLHRATARSAA